MKVLLKLAKRNETILFYCLFISSISISASAYVGINGNHVWRQSDVYSQILGFLSNNRIAPMTDFFGTPSYYDTPIYQIIVAQLSYITNSEALVAATFFNIFLWALLLIVGLSFLETLQSKSGKYFVFLLSTSPLFIHYFSAPLPDNLALVLSLIAIFLAVNYRKSFRFAVLSIIFISVAALIKSPVPFVFLIFYAALTLLENGARLFFSLFNMSLFAAALFCASASEIIRGDFLASSGSVFAADPSWYFGTFELRISLEFWAQLITRSVVDPFANLTLGVIIVCLTLYLLFRTNIHRSSSIVIVLASLAALIVGWLTFSNVYYIHDYYQLPVTVFIFLIISLIIGNAEKYFGVRDIYPLAFILFLTPVLLIYGTSKRDLHTSTIFETISNIVNRSERILFVSDDFYKNNTSFGGLIGRQFTRTTHQEMNFNCSDFLSSFDAIIVLGNNLCVSNSDIEFEYYFDNGRFEIYAKN